MDTNLSKASASFWGEHTNDNSGWTITGVGDVNGDGYDDFLIGAALNDDGGFNAGQTYLTLGKASGWAMDMNLSNADASFWGESLGDNSGFSVAGAGDVNGDGYDDILIGTYLNGDGGSNAGQTYLILGKASGWVKDMNLSNADASFWGENAYDWSGWSVAGAGDVNGDGYDDILIGVYQNDDGGSNAGQTYLIFGKPSGWAMNTNLSNADASFWGEDAEDHSGYSVAGAGDVNGDGYDDILIGASFDDDGGNAAGQTYLIFGKSVGWAMDTDLSNADASFWGEDGSDSSGWSVAGAGDVNGDGYDDILIGAPWDSDGGNSVGQTYLQLGKASGWVMDMNLSNADASFWGENAGDCSGYSVAAAGDVNGDGYDDILIGAYFNDDGGSNTGQTYIILGKVLGWAMDTYLSTADASFWGENAEDYSGAWVAGAGDVDGDGYDDILISAIKNDEGGVDSGQTYLIHLDLNSKPISIQSVKAYNSGYSVEIPIAIVNDTVYIELQGTDMNASRKDIALVNVTSNVSSPVGIQLRLMETGINTGIYRGNFKVATKTRDEMGWIKASDNETIVISSVQDASKKATVYIGMRIRPSTDITTVQEDDTYTSHYSTFDDSNVLWSFNSNATWLGWNATTHNLSGIPRNDHVGSCWVNLSISIGAYYIDSHNFTITVNNTLPEINTTDIATALEDGGYNMDYNSTDDGQGTITWHLTTNASSWLAINSSTGVLSGTPTNNNIGIHRVNISVDDGNGGWDWQNFTLGVMNTNDQPVINTTDNITAYEDMTYFVQYQADDIDVGDILTWYMSTNANEWLTMESTGIISGTPENDDVGIYWVNVSITDAVQAMDFHNFTLEVFNVNDLPVITSTPILEAKVGVEYAYNVTAYDVDKGDILTYSLDERPVGMAIDASNGSIKWTPTSEQVGTNWVIVKVTDGNASVPQAFEINVTEIILPPNHAPNITSSSPLKAAVGIKYTYQVVAVDEDLGDILHYSLDKAPNGMTIDSSLGLIEWTPTSRQVGEQQVIVTVFDGRAWVQQEFKVLVKSGGVVNNKPTIDVVPDQAVEVGQPFSYQAVGKDVDPEDTLVFTLLEKPSNMTISASGAISWTPTADQVGTHKVTVKVFDGTDEASVSFTITVKEKEGGKTGPGGTDLLMPFLILLVIIIVAVAVAALVMRKKGKGMKDPPDGKSP